MNRFFILLSFFYLFSTAGCKDDDSKEDMNVIPGWGTASAIINNKQWYGIPNLKANVKNPDLYFFSVNKYNSRGALENDLNIDAVKYSQLISEEKIKLYKRNYQTSDTTSATFFTLIGGDALTGAYAIIENDTIEDYIQFFDFDSSTKEVSGIFQGSFAVLDWFNPSTSGYGDTIIIRDGVFHTKIQ